MTKTDKNSNYKRDIKSQILNDMFNKEYVEKIDKERDLTLLNEEMSRIRTDVTQKNKENSSLRRRIFMENVKIHEDKVNKEKVLGFL